MSADHPEEFTGKGRIVKLFGTANESEIPKITEDETESLDDLSDYIVRFPEEVSAGTDSSGNAVKFRIAAVPNDLAFMIFDMPGEDVHCSFIKRGGLAVAVTIEQIP
jgi:hypothetical protein